MPGRNGSGPTGAGPMTGRGMGFCSGRQAGQHGLGYFCRRFLGRGFGFGRGFIGNSTSFQSDKEQLQAQRDALKNQLDALEKELERLSE